MSATQLQGRCLCGAVTFVAQSEKMEMDVCHCGMCRRWAGGVFMSVDCGLSLEMEGAESLGVYQSSEWGERCFCKSCGTTLFWRMREDGRTFVSAQAFDQPDAFKFSSEIFIDRKPANYAFANDTKKMTEAEFMAMFASGGN